jgi:hypothetical protein
VRIPVAVAVTVTVHHWLLWVLLDGIAPRWFHVRIVILARPINKELLSIVIPLRPSQTSSLNQQVVPDHQLDVDWCNLAHQ